MNTITDQLNDKDFKYFYKIAKSISSEALLGEIRDMELDYTEFQKVASDQYADPINRKFPVNDRGNTILSKLYFDLQKTAMDQGMAESIENKLDTYLDLYDVPESYFPTMTKEASSIDASKGKEHYLLPGHELCKIDSLEGLIKMGEDFSKNSTNLQISDRVEFARNFIKAAQDYNIDEYPYEIAKYASMLDTDLANTTYLLNMRAGMCHRKGDKDSADAYVKLANDLSLVSTEDSNSEEYTKLAETINTLDEVSGLTAPKYDKKIPDAYASVFNKVAETGTDIKNPDNEKASKEKPLTKSEIISQYGEDILEEIEDDEGNIDYDKLNNLKKMI